MIGRQLPNVLKHSSDRYPFRKVTRTNKELIEMNSDLFTSKEMAHMKNVILFNGFT